MILGLRDDEYCLNGDVIIRNTPNWVYFKTEELRKLRAIEILTAGKPITPDTYGKWMYFFNDLDFAFKLCVEAIESGVVAEAKHSAKSEGVCCFYLDGSDLDAHKKVIQFFLDHDLIQRTKAGKLFNISFKYNRQTRNGEYDEDFHAEFKLSQLIDLETGEWKV